MTFRTIPSAPRRTGPPEQPDSPATAPRVLWTQARRLPELLLLAVVTLITLFAVTDQAVAPDPLPGSAPAAEFSATRAHAHVERLATVPHPVGTPAHDTVRDHLLHELGALGLKPTVRSSVGVDTDSGAYLATKVENIQATLAGSDPTGRVLVVAHYDSVEIGPGATDDGHGVATMLETIRALRAGPAPRNDITFLFTDGEEMGMVGAHAYADSGRLGDPARTVVLNLEARGSSGRAVMFETGAHNAALVPALDGHVPATTSLAYEVYRLLPNNTDFSVFREAGVTGMNFATIGSSANYDNPTDSLANSSKASLQDMGATVLAATRKLGAADIPSVQGSSGATYFTVGGLLLLYPSGLVLPLAALALLACAAAVWFALRRRAVRGRALLTGAAAVPVPLVAAAAVGWAGWQVITLFRPDYTGFTFGNPYRPEVTALGLALLTAVAVWAWAAVLRRGRGALELGAAVTGWLTLLTLVTAVLVPGASYLFLWPALAGAAGLALGAWLPETSRWRDACSALAALPGAALLAPVAVLLFHAVGLAVALVPLIVVALLAAALVAPFTGQVRGRAFLVRAGLAALVAVAVTTAGVVRDGVDRQHPAQVSLLYTVDGDRGRARWVSNGLGDHAWVDSYVKGDRALVEDDFPALREPAQWRTGPAPLITVSTPTLKVLSTRRVGSVREVTVRMGAEHGTPAQLMLFADTTSGTVEGLTVAGRKLPGGHNRVSGTGRWTYGFIYAAPPAGGVDLTLRVGGDGPLRLRVLSKTAGFPAGALRDAQPPTATWSAWFAGYTVATKAFTI